MQVNTAPNLRLVPCQFEADRIALRRFYAGVARNPKARAVEEKLDRWHRANDIEWAAAGDPMAARRLDRRMRQ